MFIFILIQNAHMPHKGNCQTQPHTLLTSQTRKASYV
jgi:hypothetical protein